MLRATYSASVVERATSVCILEAQEMGQLAYMMTNPVLLLAVLGSFDSFLCQLTQKSASTYQSKDWLLLGLRIMPLSLVARR